MIELLNMHVARITISEYEYRSKHTSLAESFKPFGYREYVYNWMKNDNLGKHIVNMINPDDLDITFHLDSSRQEYHVDISTWLTQSQIDKIELAFFIKLRRRGYNTKYIYE